MDGSEAERDLLDLVAEEFAQACRQGKQPSISEYALRFPALADQLRDLLPSVLVMEQLKRHKKADVTLPQGIGIEWLGDYHILREIGRGGMGIVFEAEQKTLGRHVALKVLPKHALIDPKRLQRFQREAQAAARLHHTNIVPVYGIGEAEGLHYFVMQYIQGQGLNEVLVSFREKRPRPAATDQGARRRAEPVPAPPCGQASADNHYWRWVAQVGVQTADALHYAHHQGILHRDIKPANIILDTLGTVWITDFGLAKFAQQSDLTSPGDILGTLQYMAPEALQSQADARSDVCSLGLTLYELLTLRPPFSDASPAQLLRQISEHNPLQPRQINPAIPRDLETVILKAIARNPEQRYPNAAGLADDLRRFLDDRPIQARPIGWVERGWRWCRRNRVVAGLLVAVAASLLLALVVGWIGYLRTTEALARESQRRQDADTATRQAQAATRQAEAATQRAEASAALSLQALDEMFTGIESPDELFQPGPGQASGRPERPDRPGQRNVSKEHAVLLQSILRFYDRFAAENATNRTLQADAARANYRIGDIQQRLGEFEQAQAAYERALGIVEQLRVQFPENHDYTLLASELHGRLGMTLRRRNRPQDAEEHHRQALSLAKSLTDLDANSSPYRLNLSLARCLLGQCLLEEKQFPEARKLLDDAIADAKACMREVPAPRLAGVLRTEYRCLAEILTALGEKTLAEAASRKAEELAPGPPSGRPPLDPNRPPSGNRLAPRRGPE